MSLLRLVISTLALIATCTSSGHFIPASGLQGPVVRYAPFYNFPTGVRSIHAVAPIAAGLPVAPPPIPAQFAAPVLPPPAPPAPVFPAPTSFFPAPAPVFPASAPVFPAPGPVFSAPTFAAAPAPVFPHLLPRLTPSVSALPAVSPLYAQALHAPFAPVVRAVAPAPPHFFTPAVAPVPFAVAKALPFSIPPYHLHLHNKFLAPVPFGRQVAWK